MYNLDNTGKVTKLPNLYEISNRVRMMSQEEFDSLLEEILVDLRTKALAEAGNGAKTVHFEAPLPLMLQEKRNRHVLDSIALQAFKEECEEVNVYVSAELKQRTNILVFDLSW